MISAMQSDVRPGTGGERATLPAPPADMELPSGLDVPTAMRAMMAALRRRIARGMLDITSLRDLARTNERDAQIADASGRAPYAAWHREQAALWYGMAERLRAEVRECEALLEQYEQWASGGAS